MNRTSNAAVPAEFIECIAAELRAITKSWNRIGSTLSEAEEVFGYDSDAFKQILKAAKFSRGTATKLVKIARSERLQKHSEIFEKCQAWTTLYEITTLSDEQFSDLLGLVVEGEIVTYGMVRKVKGTPKKADAYKVAFTVRIDENALKGGLVDGAEFERLLDLIAQIQDTVPFIRVDSVDRFDEEGSHYVRALQKEYDRLMRGHLALAIKKYKRNSPEWKSYKRNRGGHHPSIANFGSEDEVRLAFDERPAEVLGILGYDEFDQAATYSEAQIAVERKNEKFVRSANTPFHHANTIVSAANSNSTKSKGKAALTAE